MRLIDRLVTHILATRYEDLDATAIEAARDRLIDTIGCMIGGADAPGNHAYIDLVRSWGGHPQATVVAHGDRVPLHHAALLNALTCRSFDFEVTGPEAEGINAGKMVGHVPSTTEPTAFSTAEFMKSSGKALLTAVVVGGDIGARIAVSDKFDFDKCFEVCGTANAFGATAIAGRLLGANHAQLVNAYGILLHMMSGSFQSLWDGVHSFKLPGALAASNAITAVQLSMRGFGGVKDALESPQGYYALFGNDPAPEHALADLGEIYYVKGMHKLHPSCYGNHNPIEAALEITGKHRFEAADIETVTLDVPPNRIKHFLNQPVATDDGQVRLLFSIPYSIANVLLRKEVRIEHYAEANLRVPELLALTRKVRMVPNLPLGNNQASRLTVTLKDGRSFTAGRDRPKGWKETPTSAADIRAKFWRNVDYSGAVSRSDASAALALLEQIETVGDVSGLAAILGRRAQPEDRKAG